MMRPPVRHTAPAELPVTIEELRRFCRVEGEGDDDHLRRLAASATSRLDGYAGQLGRAIITQTWRQGFDAFPHPMEPKLRLKLPDVTSAKIFLPGGGGEEVELSSDRSVLARDFIGWYVVPASGASWPSGAGIVEYECGYGPGPDNVDPAIREAIAVMVQNAYRMIGEDASLRNEAVDGAASRGFFGPEIMGNATAAHVRGLLKNLRWRPV